MVTKVILTVLIFALGGAAMWFDRAASCEVQLGYQADVIACKQLGVVGDWVSGGNYSCLVDAQGNRVSSRAY